MTSVFSISQDFYEKHELLPDKDDAWVKSFEDLKKIIQNLTFLTENQKKDLQGIIQIFPIHVLERMKNDFIEKNMEAV